jgi:hypothetical protein
MTRKTHLSSLDEISQDDEIDEIDEVEEEEEVEEQQQRAYPLLLVSLPALRPEIDGDR